jgi:hypothetical protein
MMETAESNMATMPSADRVTSQQLLKAVERLPADELERFVANVGELRARRRTDRLNAAESRLLATINRGFPERWWRRYEELIAKRAAETLTDAEHRELLRLTQRAETQEAKRVATLLKLAQLRNQPLTRLLKDLGIPAHSHD